MIQTLNSTAWHFKLANFGTRRIWTEDGSDICEYTRAVLKGLLLLMFATIFTLGAAAVVCFTLANTYSWLFLGYELHELSKIVWLVVFILGGVVLAALGAERWADYKEEQREKLRGQPPKPPTFATLAYRKFKDKTCFRLEFK